MRTLAIPPNSLHLIARAINTSHLVNNSRIIPSLSYFPSVSPSLYHHRQTAITPSGATRSFMISPLHSQTPSQPAKQVQTRYTARPAPTLKMRDRRSLITSDRYDSQNNVNIPSVTESKGRFVRIVEVSPRDGLQNLPPPAVPTAIKLELIKRLLAAGLRNIEVGSFVRNDRIPQMADTAILLPQLPEPSSIPAVRSHRQTTAYTQQPQSKTSNHPISIPESAQAIHYPVLVPNMRGLDNLLALEQSHRMETGGNGRLTDEIAVFVSATEAFSQANNNTSLSRILSSLPPLISKATTHGYRTRGYISCVITCPYAHTATPPGDVVDVAEKLLGMGCYEISLGDTTGEGNPEAWKALWGEIQRRGLPIDKFAAHCHDTFSLALSSILTLLPLGLKTIDTSLAGLGGCPYSPGATGNVPTEDVVYALHKMGYETGVDLDKLVEVGEWLAGALGVRNESRVGRAIWARRKKGVGEGKEDDDRKGDGEGS